MGSARFLSQAGTPQVVYASGVDKDYLTPTDLIAKPSPTSEQKQRLFVRGRYPSFNAAKAKRIHDLQRDAHTYAEMGSL